MTETICRDCHRGIHAIFSNKELERTYNTVEALLGHEELRNMVAFIARQDPGGRVRMRLTKSRSRQRRNG